MVFCLAGDGCALSRAWPVVEGSFAPGQLAGMQPEVWVTAGVDRITNPACAPKRPA